MPQVTGVKVSGTPAKDAFTVEFDAVTGAKTYVIRWGVNGDGLLDDDMIISGTNSGVGITDAISSSKVAPMAGKTIDVWVQAFNSDFTTPDEAMRSSEYDPNNWSQLLTVAVPTK